MDANKLGNAHNLFEPSVVIKDYIVCVLVSGNKTEFKIIKTKLRFKIEICLSDFVSKSSINTIISIRNGIRITLTNKVSPVETYDCNVT